MQHNLLARALQQVVLQPRQQRADRDHSHQHPNERGVQALLLNLLHQRAHEHGLRQTERGIKNRDADDDGHHRLVGKEIRPELTE